MYFFSLLTCTSSKLVPAFTFAGELRAILIIGEKPAKTNTEERETERESGTGVSGSASRLAGVGYHD